MLAATPLNMRSERIAARRRTTNQRQAPASKQMTHARFGEAKGQQVARQHQLDIFQSKYRHAVKRT